MSRKIGAVLVLGGGVAGIQAALDLAESGFKVYLADSYPSIGGVMAMLDKTFPTNDCAMCILSPKLVEASRHPNIEVITNVELESVEGEAGNFKVKLLKKPRRINEEKCTGCGVCAQYCPVEAIDEFNMGLCERPAVYIPYPQAVPLTYVIDYDKCIGCGTCCEVCKAGAIEYDQKEKEVNLEVGAIILALGFEPFNPECLPEYGYGLYANVVTSIEFERILSASGPYMGLLLRPSDGEIPKRIAFIQCVGSRDARIGKTYCSSVCCMYSIKQAIIAKEHAPGVDCTIFYMDLRAYGKGFEEYYKKAKEEYNIRFVRCRVPKIEEEPETKNLIVKYEDENGILKSEKFDLVVLAVGFNPPKKAKEVAEKLGIELNDYGFCSCSSDKPLETSRPGIFVCGAFSGPKDIPDSVAEASGVASKAASIIASERGKLVSLREYPAERDVSREEPRIGVFVCHCGINIGGVVNVPEVVEYAKTLPYVVYAESNLYTCSQDTQARIKEKIREYNLNRVIVASCTPRTHEPLFRETLREAGLNPYLFEMVNIREHCSWVHMHNPKKATEKAKHLIHMAVAKAKLLKPLKKPIISINSSALVIGGGLSGIIASLELAKQGFEVHLVEKENELGGNLRYVKYTVEGLNIREFLKNLIREVKSNDKIHIYLNSEVVNVEGYVGNFESVICHDNVDEKVKHGVIIVAIGAEEYKPYGEYFYGEDSRVLTQLEFEEILSSGKLNAEKIVMIQCVKSRVPERPYCSRICCTQAIKNALKAKEINPNAEIYILYRDIRTYGFKEKYYEVAREKGIIFINYSLDNKPRVVKENGKLTVYVYDAVMKNEIAIEADLLILSSGLIPRSNAEELSKMIKVPLTKNKFFLEAHTKLKPVDFATDGIFLCGLAHYPKFIEECIAQACGAAARAATILSKPYIEGEGAIAFVNEVKCRGCGRCEEVCEYGAIKVEEHNGRLLAKVNEALCKGCGACSVKCPTGAVKIYHFRSDQILSMVSAIERWKEN